MPYVPPHRRLGEAKRSPQALGGRRITVPFPVIREAASCILQFHVLSGEARLQFQVFQGETYAHLDGKQQYIVTVVDDGDHPGNTNGSLAENIGIESLSLDVMTATRRGPESLAASSVHDSRGKLKMVLRLGTIVFRKDTQQVQSFSPAYLEEESSRLRRTFHTAITPELFHQFEHLALQQEAVEVITCERYHFRVKNIDRPRYLVRCVCERAHESEHSLVLKKLKLDPLRHLVSDYLCVGRKTDLRIAVYSETLLTDVPDEERAAYEALASAAVIDDTVKGGLRWPLGRDSFAKRFSVCNVEHRRVTIIRGKETQWKFMVANRAEMEASAGRVTYELNLRAIDWEGNEDLASSHLRDLVNCAGACI
ncbi:uncharacterized protein LOC112349424 [Selaginella moellendorffii]|uniref:uncharacterized protein LOC112349424 n=1 Tax=Selaginella moellendorffii TaxID=88036 RepID=UPI000D1C498F|nr:uncharacterized protein LOC112349424 [Selaginella moellendorffii]|eukprot:XP_024539625.1 uncharacterized protein LOC112349424 [Selaginella moellendorffii]